METWRSRTSHGEDTGENGEETWRSKASHGGDTGENGGQKPRTACARHKVDGYQDTGENGVKKDLNRIGRVERSETQPMQY